MQHRDLMVEIELMDELKINSREMVGVFPADFGRETQRSGGIAKRKAGRLRVPPSYYGRLDLIQGIVSDQQRFAAAINDDHCGLLLYEAIGSCSRTHM